MIKVYCSLSTDCTEICEHRYMDYDLSEVETKDFSTSTDCQRQKARCPICGSADIEVSTDDGMAHCLSCNQKFEQRDIFI